MITIDDFYKIELKVGTVLEASEQDNNGIGITGDDYGCRIKSALIVLYLPNLWQIIKNPN